MATQPQPTIVDDIGPELLASEIEKVSAAARALLGSRLTERAIILLIQDLCPRTVSQKTIAQVLRGAQNLSRAFVKQAPP